ncbi:hypothetical protein Q0F99_07365 [Rathayibacter oskolensis]|uniref:hypothetical protein n=1 Tax=Rathayibacter oskolensis TaxID=1891671 RepID=UPI0026603993|nr:hypothetical protein [Rathayibacter oskolensis]WKK72724.1 hypothetical protein Q0F99_07365 [Rathayibacter oskolensis]
MTRTRTALLLALITLALTGCSAVDDSASDTPIAPLAVGDCLQDDGDTSVPVDCGDPHNRIVFASTTSHATTEDELLADLGTLCDALADPARLDSVSATGETGVPDGDSTITCLYATE